MEQEVKERLLLFLQELEDSGKLKSDSEDMIRDLNQMLSQENISKELENKIFQTIEILKKEYFLFGMLGNKSFNE